MAADIRIAGSARALRDVERNRKGGPTKLVGKRGLTARQGVGKLPGEGKELGNLIDRW
jgi:hypothetical protein